MTPPDTSPDPPPWAAVLAAFLTVGLFAQTAQILLLRELLVALDGDELALGVMLAAWLLFVGLGAVLAAPAARAHLPGRHYALCLALAVCSLPPALVLVRLARPILHTPLGTPLGLGHSVLLSCAAVAIPAACIGLLFPLMVRVTRARPAIAYGAESIGALLGGLLFVFVVVTRLSPLAIGAGAGLLAAGAAAGLLGPARGAHKTERGVLIALVLACGLGTALGGRADASLHGLRWAEALPGYELLATRESPYGRYSVLEASGQVSLFLDGRLQHDVPDPHAAGALVHTALLQHPEPLAVLIIGGGLAGNVQRALEHGPQRVDLVELDPAPQRLLEAHAPPAVLRGLDAPQVRVHHADPAALLDGSLRRYDAIIVDVGDPSTLGLNRLYAERFIRAAAGHLEPGGVLAIGISSEADLPGPLMRRRNAVVYHTVRGALPETIATPGDPCLVIGRRGTSSGPGSEPRPPMTLDPDELARRLQERGAEAPAYLAMLYADPYPADRAAIVNRELAAWPDAAPQRSALDLLEAPGGALTPPPVSPRAADRINTDSTPRAYWFTRVFESAKHEPRLLPLVEGLPVAVRWALGVAAAGALLAAVLMRRGPHRPPGDRDRAAQAGLSLASATYAFAVMAMQVAVVLWYQSRLGQVYVGLALLTAAFMSGVSIGSLLAGRLGRPRAALLATQAALIALAGLALLSGGLIGPGAVTVTAFLCAGALGVMLGGHFACCAALWSSRAAGAVGAARWLYGADLVGGAAAALVIAAVVVPGDGLAAALLWAALFAGVAIMVTLRLAPARGAAFVTGRGAGGSPATTLPSS
jgi:spermidine synthase